MFLLAGGIFAGLILAAAGLVVVAMSTGPGHDFVLNRGLGILREHIAGTVRVGSLGGSLWRTADVHDIELADSSGTAIVKIARLKVGYGLANLLRGRIVFRSVEIIRPTVVLEQRRDGSWNIQHLFQLLDSTESDGGPRALVDLRDVTITDGTFILRRRVTPDSLDTRRLLAVNTTLSRLRVSHPDSSAMLALITELSARLVEPAIVITGAGGTFSLDGDSAQFDLDRFALPDTRAAVTGRVRWGGEHTVGLFAIDARPVAFADFAGLVPSLPRTGGGRLHVGVEMLANGGMVVDVRDADLRTGRSRVLGRARVTRSPSGRIALGGADVRAAPLDMALLRQWVDTLPVDGLVTGRVQARGSSADLAVTVNLALADEGASGVPRSELIAAGRVAVGGAPGMVFRGVQVRRLDVPVASLRRFSAALPSNGHLTLRGRLDGPWRSLTLDSAMLVHAHGDSLAPSVLRGRVAFAAGTGGAPARIDADLAADTLSFDLLAEAFPQLPLRGTASGVLRVSGTTDSLGAAFDLAGASGRLSGTGLLRLTDSALTVHATGALDSLDLHHFIDAAPPTRLAGRWSLDLAQSRTDTAAAASGVVQLALDSSRVAGVAFDRAGASVSLAANSIMVDSVWAHRPDLALRIAGALGRAGGPAGQLTFSIRADTLAAFTPLLRWARAASGAPAEDAALARADGALNTTGRIVGTTDSWSLDARLEAAALTYDTVGARGLALEARATKNPAAFRFDVSLTADSLWAGQLAYSRASAAAEGSTDSFTVRAEARFNRAGEVRVAGRVARGASRLDATVEALDFQLAGRHWQLLAPVRIAVLPDTLVVDSLDLHIDGEEGHIHARGRIARQGAAAFTLGAENVPFADFYAFLQKDTTGIGGIVSASAEVRGTAQAPTIDLSARLTDGRLGDYRVPLLELTGRYEDHRLQVRGGLFRDSTHVVSVDAGLPLDLALQRVATRKLPGEIAVTLLADSVDLSIVNSITDVVREVGGTLVADVRVRGTWEDPVVSGSAEIVEGAVTVPTIGARYSGINARLGLADSTITVERAQLRNGGTLYIGGNMVLRTIGRPILDLTMRAQRFTAMNMRQFAGATASGEMTLRGPSVGATLAGRVTVESGYLAFADLVEKRIVNLDDPEFRAIVDSSLAGARDLAPGIVTVFLDSLNIENLRVAMGADVWLRSSEANIKLGGDFQISKAIEDGLPRYRLDGTLNAERGSYRLVLTATSKEFRVTRGTVRFFGTPDFDPEMNIAAEHTVRLVDGGQLVVRAVITGTLLSPQLRLESDQRPPLGETEIVSYLMFGRPSFELAGGETGGGEQRLLANALGLLAGGAAGQLEQSLSDLGLPIDYLTIRPGAGLNQSDLLSGARVEAGTQLGERTFLTLNSGLCEVRRGQPLQAVGAGVEYRLSGRWTLEASYEPLVSQCRLVTPSLTGTKYQFGFDLFWQLGNR